MNVISAIRFGSFVCAAARGFLVLQVLIDFIPISEVVGDGSVHFFWTQRTIELLNGFRRVALLEGNHHGVERNAQRAHPRCALAQQARQLALLRRAFVRRKTRTTMRVGDNLFRPFSANKLG
jgi:hypothetical protein